MLQLSEKDLNELQAYINKIPTIEKVAIELEKAKEVLVETE